MTLSAANSPCINVCTLDNSGMCVGCGRLLEEIAAWSRMSAMQRQDICERARQRLHESPGSNQSKHQDRD